MSSGVVDKLIPVGTLVLGASLTSIQAAWQGLGSARRTALEFVAEHPRFMWTKGSETGWVELQVYLRRLHGALRLAGVPPAYVAGFTQALTAFWHSVEEHPDEEVGLIGDTERGHELDVQLERLYPWLHSPWLTRLRVKPRAKV